MSRYNINSILIVIGFLFLLAGFFMNQKGTLDFQIHDTYLVVGKAQLIRTMGILTVLNGLVYALFDRLNFYFNRRFKYFGIVLFFLSLIIVWLGVLFFGISNGLQDGTLVTINESALGVLTIFAGFFTLFLSLLMPLVIWIKVSLGNIFSKNN